MRPEMDAVDSQPIAFPDVHVPGASDERDVRTREHPAEIATDSTGAHDGDARPRR